MARIRSDRNNEIVIVAKKGNGKPYTRDEADLIAGVLGDKVYLFENRCIAEYWAAPNTVKERWIELKAA